MGHTDGLEAYLEKTLREHERRGGLPASELNPLQALTSCMKLLRNRGFFKLQHRNSWERVEFIGSINKGDQDKDSDVVIAAAVMVPSIAS